MLSNNDKIEKGTLKLQSSSRPPLPAGVYTVNAQVGVDSGTGSSIPGSFPVSTVSFTITAPRFSLDLSLIHSTFPLAGSTGSYNDAMPHIILNRKTLPWERVISKNTGEKRPWLYLLLLTDDELPKDAVKEMKLNEVLIAPADVILPAITLTDEEKKREEKIKVLEISAALFKSIAPLTNELDFLAHTRQVDTTDRFNQDRKDKTDNNAGWLSVLAGNRLPKANSLNTAFLVSLEGHGDVIDGKKDTSKGNIRLVVMKQWAFKVEGPSFTNLLQQLNGNAQPMQMEVKPKIGLPISQAALKAITYGYTIVNHDKRDGKKAVSWYRSPLVPIQKPAPFLHSYQSADKALRLDEETGIFDISYAAAWQLGRLLALENPAFSASISDWKNTFKSQKPLLIAKGLLTQPQTVKGVTLDAILNSEQLDPLITAIESDEVLTDYVINLWTKSKKNP